MSKAANKKRNSKNQQGGAGRGTKTLHLEDFQQQPQVSTFKLTIDDGDGDDKAGRPAYNNALGHAMDMVSSERARTDAGLMSDFEYMKGNCFYLKEMICKRADHSSFATLKEELASAFDGGGASSNNTDGAESVGMGSRQVSNASSVETTLSQSTVASLKDIKAANDEWTGEVTSDENQVKAIKWSKHMLIENPTTSPHFNELVAAVAEYFDLEVYQTRLNYYPDATAWKPFHHDSHAYGGKALREDFTAGISLGSSRDLAFIHPQSQRQFNFNQENGDVFAFSSEVNSRFQHGVPKVACGAAKVGPRLSIIAWGRRRSINERNGGVVSTPKVLLKGLSTEALEGNVHDGGKVVRDQVIAAAQDLVGVDLGAGPILKKEDQLTKKKNIEKPSSSSQLQLDETPQVGGDDAEKKKKEKKKRSRLQ